MNPAATSSKSKKAMAAQNLKERREKKVESKTSNNKGLIGAATMLSVVSMLNYMGNEAGVPNSGYNT